MPIRSIRYVGVVFVAMALTAPVLLAQAPQPAGSPPAAVGPAAETRPPSDTVQGSTSQAVSSSAATPSTGNTARVSYTATTLNPWLLWGIAAAAVVMWAVLYFARRRDAWATPVFLSAVVLTLAFVAAGGYSYGRATAVREFSAYLTSTGTGSASGTKALLEMRDTVTLALLVAAATFIALFTTEARRSPARIDTHWGGLGGGAGGWHISTSLIYLLLGLTFLVGTVLNARAPDRAAGPAADSNPSAASATR